MSRPIEYNEQLRSQLTEKYGPPTYDPDEPGAIFGPGTLTWYRPFGECQAIVTVMRTGQ